MISAEKICGKGRDKTSLKKKCSRFRRKTGAPFYFRLFIFGSDRTGCSRRRRHRCPRCSLWVGWPRHSCRSRSCSRLSRGRSGRCARSDRRWTRRSEPPGRCKTKSAASKPSFCLRTAASRPDRPAWKRDMPGPAASRGRPAPIWRCPSPAGWWRWRQRRAYTARRIPGKHRPPRG